jgi:CubicO group peptidase (beta-lactamase class C family)
MHPYIPSIVVASTLFVTVAFGQSCVTSISGTGVPALASLDQAILAAMQQNGVRGGALAISYNGRLIFARGYGCADSDSNSPVQPDSLMRVASVSKVFTAIGVLQLYQQGKLSLDAKVFGPIWSHRRAEN